MRKEPIAWHCVSLVNTGKIEITQDARVVELRRQESWNQGGKAWVITPLYLRRKSAWLPILLVLVGIFFIICSYGTQSAAKELIYSVLANIYIVGSLISWD